MKKIKNIYGFEDESLNGTKNKKFVIKA